MDQSDDLPLPRRRLLLPVVLATVLLTVIAMFAGLKLSEQHRAAGRSGSAPHLSDPAPTPATAAPDGKPCRPETQKWAEQQYGVRGVLRAQLRLRTKTSVVWICADPDSHLYYHANRGGDDADWIENKTALFLAGVRSDGNGEYSVTATNGTRFLINRERLAILHTDGREEVQPAAG